MKASKSSNGNQDRMPARQNENPEYKQILSYLGISRTVEGLASYATGVTSSSANLISSVKEAMYGSFVPGYSHVRSSFQSNFGYSNPAYQVTSSKPY